MSLFLLSFIITIIIIIIVITIIIILIIIIPSIIAIIITSINIVCLRRHPRGAGRAAPHLAANIVLSVLSYSSINNIVLLLVLSTI